MTFLTIVTGTYRRPKMLAKCIESVEAQTDPDWEHIFLDGEEGGGIHGFHTRLGKYQDRYSGEYIYVLPDDDMLIDPEFVAGLKAICEAHNPDVVMVKADKLELGIMPSDVCWELLPIYGQIDLLNYVVRAPLWKAFSSSFTKKDHPYYDGAWAGDFSFIRDVFQCNVQAVWWNRLVAASQRISRGAPE